MDELKDIKKRRAAANTEREWEAYDLIPDMKADGLWNGEEGWYVSIPSKVDFEEEGTAKFIAHAPTDIDLLLKENAELREEIAMLRKAGQTLVNGLEKIIT